MIGVDKSWETYDIDDGNPYYSWSGHGNIYQTNSWKIRAMHTGFLSILIPRRWKAGML